MAFLPNTRGRLAISVQLRVSKVNDDIPSGDNLPSSTLDLANLANFVTVGSLLDATNKLEIKQSRTNSRIYSLGTFAFQPFRIVPGPIKTDIELSRVVLYKRDFLEALGFTQGNLFNQTIPFIIDVELKAPTGAARTIRFHDCWITNSTLPVDLSGGDPLVVQRLSITAGFVEADDAKFGGIGRWINRVAKALKLR